MQIGTKIGDIGKTIQETIESFGFKPVRNLSGHGLSQWNIHDQPSIPNFNDFNEEELKKGMIIAIEPFATDGIGLIEEKGDASVFMMTGKKSLWQEYVKNFSLEKYYQIGMQILLLAIGEHKSKNWFKIKKGD